MLPQGRLVGNVRIQLLIGKDKVVTSLLGKTRDGVADLLVRKLHPDLPLPKQIRLDHLLVHVRLDLQAKQFFVAGQVVRAVGGERLQLELFLVDCLPAFLRFCCHFFPALLELIVQVLGLLEIVEDLLDIDNGYPRGRRCGGLSFRVIPTPEPGAHQH